MTDIALESYKQLAETAPVLFYVVDEDLKYTYINSFFSRVHSISQQEAIGLSIADVIGEDGFTQNLPHYRAVLAGQFIEYQSFFFKADGEPHHYNAIYKPLKLNDNIVGFTGVVIDITAEVNLERLCRTDPLTSLANRRQFENNLENLLLSKSTDNFGLLIIDIDYFKAINDDLGHSKGDDALVHLGKILNEVVGEDGEAYRVGGDEFIVILTKPLSAKCFYEGADKLCTKVKDTQLIPNRLITVSMGGVLFNAGDNRSKLLKKADVALYESKEKGRNRVTIIK